MLRLRLRLSLRLMRLGSGQGCWPGQGSGQGRWAGSLRLRLRHHGCGVVWCGASGLQCTETCNALPMPPLQCAELAHTHDPWGGHVGAS